jgi:hypothetical protein
MIVPVLKVGYSLRLVDLPRVGPEDQHPLSPDLESAKPHPSAVYTADGEENCTRQQEKPLAR